MTCKDCINNSICDHLKDSDADICEAYINKSLVKVVRCKDCVLLDKCPSGQRCVKIKEDFERYCCVGFTNNCELKPCPFCGGKATTSHGVAATTEQFFFVSCEKCHSRTDNVYKWQYGENYEQKAIDYWNTRATIFDFSLYKELIEKTFAGRLKMILEQIPQHHFTLLEVEQTIDKILTVNGGADNDTRKST